PTFSQARDERPGAGRPPSSLQQAFSLSPAKIAEVRAGGRSIRQNDLPGPSRPRPRRRGWVGRPAGGRGRGARHGPGTACGGGGWVVLGRLWASVPGGAARAQPGDPGPLLGPLVPPAALAAPAPGPGVQQVGCPTCAGGLLGGVIGLPPVGAPVGPPPIPPVP